MLLALAFKGLQIDEGFWCVLARRQQNKQLQRIYGTAWASEKQLKDYLQRIEEAEKEITESWAKRWIFSISKTKHLGRYSGILKAGRFFNH